MEIQRNSNGTCIGRVNFLKSMQAGLSQPSHDRFIANLMARLQLNKKPSVIFQKRDRSCKRVLYTLVALEPEAIVTIDDRRAKLLLADGTEKTTENIACPFAFLETIKESYGGLPADLEQMDFAKNLNFAGGLIGYMGYGLTSRIENIRKQAQDPFLIPDATLMIPNLILNFDHENDELLIVSHKGSGPLEEIRHQLLSESDKAHEARSTLARDLSKKQVVRSREVANLDIEAALKTGFLRSSMTKGEFINRVLKAKEHILEGDAFQIVVSQRFFGSVKSDAASIFANLCKAAPSAYNFMINLPDFQYLGASPETMLSVNLGVARLCALAGTRPRGLTPRQDELNEQELSSNEKEMAEHLMLVHLARNELGKVCAPGTINVGPVAQVLRYSNVMHLGTEVFGTLESDRTTLSALRACFPRGTVSGAPKVRAMQILSELEPERRGPYAGAVGFIDRRGNLDTAIAIRSALIKDGIAHINAGAGIVYDSDPEAEYMETINKDRAKTEAVFGLKEEKETKQQLSEPELRRGVI